MVNQMIKEMHRMTTTAIMAKVMIPFLETRKACLEAMQKQGLTLDEAIEIMDMVCQDAVKITDWADKNKVKKMNLDDPKDKEDILLKALREIEGVTPQDLSDEDARKLIKEALSETDEMRKSGLI